MSGEALHHCQLLSPPGAGAIAIIRVSGPNPAEVVDRLFRSESAAGLRETSVGIVRYGRLENGGEIIDDVVVYRLGGSSEAVDICCHGGVRVVERVLGALDQVGAMLEDVEDSPPALWPSGSKIEREALAPLPRSATRQAAAFLAWQRQNSPGWLMETSGLCTTDSATAVARLERFKSQYRSSNIIIHGATVVLAGLPNSGKSTLFNRLVGREAAIVSAREGTTRDWVSATIEASGLAIRLIDTAGQRMAEDQLEALAIETGRERASAADLTLLVVDGDAPSSDHASRLIDDFSIGNAILIQNKCDLLEGGAVKSTADWASTTSMATVCVSARDGTGIPDLVGQLVAHLTFNGGSRLEPSAFTQRQVEACDRILAMLQSNPSIAQAAIADDLVRMGA